MINTQAILVDKQQSPDGNVAFLFFEPEQSFDFKEGQFVMIETEALQDDT